MCPNQPSIKNTNQLAPTGAASRLLRRRVKHRTEDGGFDVIETRSLREAQCGRAELPGKVEHARQFPIEHHWPTLPSQQIPRLDVLVAQHDRARPIAAVHKPANRAERLDLACEFVSPRLSGHHRPPGKLRPVPRRRALDRCVRPLDVERVDARDVACKCRGFDL